MKTIDDILEEIDKEGHLTLETTVAIDSLQGDIVPKLRSRIELTEKNKNISTDDIWRRIKNKGYYHNGTATRYRHFKHLFQDLGMELL